MLTKGFFNKKYKTIVTLSLLGWLVDVVANASDTVFGGLFISEEAISATGLVTPIVSLILFVSYLLSQGVANKFSNYMGAYDEDNAAKTVFVGLSTSILIGIVFGLIMYFGQNFYFNFYGAGEAIDGLARDYYKYFILYAAISPLYWTVYSLVYADGNANLIFGVDTFSAIGNVVLSIILVQFLGIRGLALGTFLSLTISCFLLIPHFYSKRNSIKIKYEYDFKLLKEALTSGSSISLSFLYGGIFDIAMNKYIIVKFGEQYLAAYAIACLIMDVATTISSASDGSFAFVGVSYGENNTVFLKKAFKKAIDSGIMISITYTLIFVVFSNFIPLIYGIENGDAYTAAIYILRVLPLFVVFKGTLNIFAFMFSLIDMSLIGNIVICLNYLVTPLCFSFVFGSLIGIKGIAWGIGLGWLVSFLIMMILIYVIKGKEYLPYGVKDSNNKIFNYEYKVCDKEIVELQNIIKDNLKSCNINKSIINKVLLTLEETLEIVKEKNEKKVLGDCSIIIDQDVVSLTTRDNGIIFDIIEESDESKSLRNYVVNSIISDALDVKYLTTNSFNRNNFRWEK